MSSVTFVVGSPRSGTTYLSRALGLADNACYLGESALFCLCGARKDSDYYRKIMRLSDVFPYTKNFFRFLDLSDRIRNKDRIQDAIRHLLLMSKVEEYDLKPSDTLYVEQRIKFDITDNVTFGELTDRFKLLMKQDGIATFARSYLNEYTCLKNVDHVIEKTPIHLRVLPVIHHIFPDAKIILIRRNKEDCLRSYFRTFGRGLGFLKYLPKVISKRIIWSQLKADEKREQWAMQQPWVRKVDFEDFVRDPEAHIVDIAEWLELNFNIDKYRAYFPEYTAHKV